ncbi:MAG: imidazole glycerol phosphate synthase subunit HisF [Clostridia bacterium]|nr:imidazole glycerol phosphate synthase subunit HisF [Clostridia bacterium]
MIAKRIIPCLDIRDGRVVKGLRFQGLRELDDPVRLARFYNEAGADELVFYDITASFEERPLFTDMLRRVASEIFIPLTVGGRVNSLADFDRVLKAGADKVSVNSGALLRPQLIAEAAEKYGSQCVVLSLDAARFSRAEGAEEFHVFAKGGREDTGRDAIAWAQEGERLGAGELVINSIDTDGVRGGFDLPLLKAIAERVGIPVIASGGAGRKEDFLSLFQLPGVDAGLAASIFHLRELSIGDLKQYLQQNGVEVRL